MMTPPLALFLSIVAAAPGPESRIAVLALRPATDADAAHAALLTPELTEAAREATKAGHVISTDEVRALLDARAAQQLLGCDDAACALDGAKLLSVDYLVLGRVGALGEELLLYLTLVDTKAQRVVARASTTFPLAGGKPALASGARRGALALFHPDAGRAADAPLRDLRMALVFSERDTSGAALETRAVETCIEEQLLDEGVALVSAEQVAAIRKQAEVEHFLAGRLPEFLTSSDVDVVLAGRAVFSPVAGVRTLTRGSRVDFSMRMIHVDTGQVVVAKQLVEMGSGFHEQQALVNASARLCAAVKPALLEALEARRERGHRVVLEVQGARAGESHEAMRAALEQLGLVARARMVRFDEHGSQWDVVVRGGDGITLAMELLGARASPLAPETAEAGRVRARVR